MGAVISGAVHSHCGRVAPLLREGWRGGNLGLGFGEKEGTPHLQAAPLFYPGETQ
jgi:hypothetical protein